MWGTVLGHTPISAANSRSPLAISIQQGSKELNYVLLQVGSSCTASLPSRNALTHHPTVRYGNAALPKASWSPWNHSCMLRHRATSILIQERCCSFVNMVLCACTIPMKVNVLHTAVDWQSTGTGSTKSSNGHCSCHKAGSSRTHHRHVTAVLPVFFIQPLYMHFFFFFLLFTKSFALLFLVCCKNEHIRTGCSDHNFTIVNTKN